MHSSERTTSPAPRLTLSPTIVLLLHAVVFVALLVLSWRKWPDPLIDFGRELYVPWRITQGDVLYRDIASLFGPLSPYVNAGFFKAFGVSLMTLVMCNLAIFALMLAGIHWLVRRCCDVRVATIVTVVVLFFGLTQRALIGNYNFVCPYSHEATHGIALSVAMLVALQLGVERRAPGWMSVGGFCFGLILLTKPEVGVAAAAAVAVCFAAFAVLGQEHRRMLPRVVVAFIAAAAVAPMLFLLYFRAHLPVRDAIRATAGAWVPLRITDVSGQVFYRTVFGLDRPWPHIGQMLLVFGMCVAFVLAAARAARTMAARAGTPAGAWALRLSSVGLLLVWVATPWLRIPRAWPVTTLATLGWSAVLFARARHDPARATRILPLLTWGAFGLALLAKIALNTTLAHYGSFLALPATTLVIIGLIKLIPDWLAIRYSTDVARMFGRLAGLTIAAGVVPYLVLSATVYRSKDVPLGSAGDRFYTSSYPGSWEGQAAREGLDAILKWSAPAETVAVLPEGVMLNYLARRASPLRVVTVMPPELVVFGEKDVLASLERGRPTLVVLVRKDMTEYGYQPFGTDDRYGRAIASWVDAHYEPVTKISQDPGTGEFRMVVLKRRADQPASSSQ